MQLIKRIRTSSNKLNIRISASAFHRNKRRDVAILPDLPVEIWQIIFAFATYISLDLYHGRDWLLNPSDTRVYLNTRYRLALVCKAWKAASMRFLYDSISVSDWDHIPFVLRTLETSRERDDAATPLGWFTQALVIPCDVLDETRDQTVLARILRCLPNLRYLRLTTTKPSLTFVETHVIDALCTSCLGLEVLETTDYVAILPYGFWSMIFDSLKNLHSFTTTFVQPRITSDLDTLTSAAASSSLTYLHLHISPSDVANAELSVPIPKLCSLQTWVYDADVADNAEFHRNVMTPTLAAYTGQLSTIILCCDFYYGHHVQTIFSLVNQHCPCLETLMLVPTRQPQNACWEPPNDSLTLPDSVMLLGICASKCGAALGGGQLRGLFRVLQCMGAMSLVAVRLTSWRNVKDLMGMNQAAEYARQYGRHVLAKQGWTFEDPDGRALW